MDNAAVVELLAIILAIDAAFSTEHVIEIFQVVMATFGLQSFLITGLPVPQDSEWHRAILCDGWPHEWFVRYGKEGYFLDDPCAARSRVASEPFLWSQLHAGDLSSRSQLIMDEAAEFGMKDGLCVPIHIPLAGPAVVTAASDNIEVPPDALPLIETLCVHTFRKLSNLQMKRDDERRPPLTPRERELLQWSAQGKSTEDISCILGVTVNTVESHQRNIRNKLDAINVVHAVVKALRRQEIQI